MYYHPPSKSRVVHGDIYIYTYIYTPHKVDFDLILTAWIDDSKPIDLRHYVFMYFLINSTFQLRIFLIATPMRQYWDLV